MAYNVKRAERMARRSDAELVRFAKARTLSSAAAIYQLRKRNKMHLLVEKEA